MNALSPGPRSLDPVASNEASGSGPQLSIAVSQATSGLTTGLLTPPDRLLRLEGGQQAWQTAYRDARPWPHLVVDQVLDEAVASEVAAEAASASPALLVRESSRRVKKDAAPDYRALGATAERLFGELGDSQFLEFLSRLTGVGGLQADPAMYNAGVFITRAGGLQRVHEDFPRHPGTGLWNRVAVLLYCCEWSPGWGGELELWPRDMSGREKAVQPAPGRLVVFETHRGTRHGVTEVSNAAARPRVVLATRYYSAEPPPLKPGSTLRRTFRRPTERRRDVLPTFSEMRDYLYSHRRGVRRTGA